MGRPFQKNSSTNHKKRKSKKHYYSDSSQHFPDQPSQLAQLDPISLQAVLDDIETGWAFDHSGVDNAAVGQTGGSESLVTDQQILNHLPEELQVHVQQQQQQLNQQTQASSGSQSPSRTTLPKGDASRGGRQSVNTGGGWSSYTSHSGAARSNSAFSIMPGFGSGSDGTQMPKRIVLIILSVFLLGLVAMATILGFGLESEAQQQSYEYAKLERAILETLQRTLEGYRTLGLVLHQASAQPSMDPAGFRIFYQYLKATGVAFPACGIASYVTSGRRGTLENETYSYLRSEYPEQTPLYNGFWGDVSTTTSTSSTPDFDYLPPNHSDVYYPLHFLEPLDDPFVRLFLDFDMHTIPSFETAMAEALTTQTPTLSELLVLPTNDTFQTLKVPWYETHTVLLWHPGIPLSSSGEGVAAVLPNRDLSVLVLKLADLFRAVQTLELDKTVSLYIYDSTDSRYDDNNKDDDDDDDFIGTRNSKNMTFLGGAQFLKTSQRNNQPGEQEPSDFFQPPVDLATLEEDFAPFVNVTTYKFANNREWTFVVALDEDELPFQVTLIFLAGYTIFVACSCFALWVHSNYYRTARINQLRQVGETEKAMLMIDNARKAAKQERALNDFLAHEVRNPLSAAISATSFVSSAIHEKNPLADEASRQSVREDVNIIDASLQFINDLLRNMLDMHRAAVGQLSVDLAPVDILHDVLEPVASMLYRRDAEYEVFLECPEDLMVMSDRLRLKQTILNLARVSTFEECVE